MQREYGKYKIVDFVDNQCPTPSRALAARAQTVDQPNEAKRGTHVHVHEDLRTRKHGYQCAVHARWGSRIPGSSPSTPQLDMATDMLTEIRS